MPLEFLVKYLLRFFTDHLKQKTVNKTTCRTPKANPRQLCALAEEFSNSFDYFCGFQDFLIIWQSIFEFSLLNSPYLIFQLQFAGAM